MNQQYITKIQEANNVLLTTPECIDLSQDKNDVVWSYQSPAAKKARTTLRQVLNDLWQSGAYNYEQLARSLRIDTQTIQALIDEQYIESKNL